MDEKLMLPKTAKLNNITPNNIYSSKQQTADFTIEDKTILTDKNDISLQTSIIKNASQIKSDKNSKIDQLKSLVEELKKEKVLPNEPLDLLAEKLPNIESLSGKEIKQVAESKKQLRTLHKSLHDKIKTGDRTAKTVRTLQTTHLLMDICKQIERDALHSKRRAIYAEVTKDMSPYTRNNPVYKTFFENTRISKITLQRVLETVESLDNPDSPSLIKGNKISVLTREYVWQTKMNILDKAINDTNNGISPKEINFEYYELSSPDMLERLEAAAKLGSPIRGVLDPGRFTILYSKKGEKTVDASEVARKLRIASYFQEQLGKYDVGICLYPVVKKLGSDQNLMHRKLLRAGNNVILGGMNANSSSGENVDAGKLIEGPATKRLTQIFKKDVITSMKAGVNDIYNLDHLKLLKEGAVRLDPSGMIALLEIATSSQKVCTTTSPAEHLQELLDKVEKLGCKIENFANWPDTDTNNILTKKDIGAYLLQKDVKPENYLTINKEAGDLIAKLIEKTINNINNADNQNKLAKISMPDDSTKGEDVMAIADTSYQRMAILLKTIASAEKFTYTQSFVVTQLVAKMFHARKEELKAQGKDLQECTIADTGIYPGGGSPNQDGMLTMENLGLTSRWALLERTDPSHPRKIHAKEIVTDKIFLSGSTNLSQKGLEKNHEMGDITFWRPDDPLSIANKQKVVDDIMFTLNHESIQIDTRKLADKKFANTPGRDVEIRKEEYRKLLTFYTLRHIDNFGKEYAKKVIQPLLKDNLVWEKVQSYRDTGVSNGYSILKAVHEVVPEDKLNAMKEALPAWKTLKYFSETGSTPEYDAAKKNL